jgi:prepilin-type N-terminal cleavage/methylation domain-containing protein
MNRAFTLVELLVVVAIVAVLVAISLPVLSAAKRSSSLAISTNSLNQLTIAGRMYLTDNNNVYWQYEQSAPGGEMWWFGFETTASLRTAEGKRFCDYSQGPLGPYMMSSGGVKTDPAFLQYSPRLKPKYQDGNYGYGYNDVLAGHNALQIATPSQMIVFATSAQVNTFQSPASASSPMIEEFYMVDDTQTTIHFRHGRNALAAFADGSVRALSMGSDMVPGSQDMRIPSANIGRLSGTYFRQAGW